MRRTLLALIVLIATTVPAIAQTTRPSSLEELALPPVPTEPWRFKRFPILAWWAPPGTATLADFELYRDAGFTLYPLNPDRGYHRAYDFAKQTGLPIIGFRDKQGFGLKPAEVEFARDDPAIVGWITNDEPGEPAAVERSIRAVHELMAADPTRWSLFNFLPPHVQPEPGAAGAMRAALRNGLPILSYDHYVMMADGTTATERHFANLRLVRDLSLEFDRPFWAFALTIKHYSYRRPSESDVRWKQFTNLAYGAKGLWYFTYWGPTDWDRWDNKAIVDPADGSPTDLYKVVSDINHAVLEVGDLLLMLRSTAVEHTDPPKGCDKFRRDEHWIAGLGGADAVVGFFVDPDGAEYALLVNDRHGPDQSAEATSQEITIRFADDVKSVRALSWLDGKAGPLQLDRHRATITLAGGTGVLLKKE